MTDGCLVAEQREGGGEDRTYCLLCRIRRASFCKGLAADLASAPWGNISGFMAAYSPVQATANAPVTKK